MALLQEWACKNSNEAFFSLKLFESDIQEIGIFQFS